MHKSTGFWYKLLVKFSPILTILLAILALVFSYFGSKVDLKLSLMDLLPPDHPAVVSFQKLTKVVGGVGYFTIVLKAEDGKSHLKIAPLIKKELQKSSLVRSVFYEREQRYFTDRLLYYLSISRLEELDRNLEKQIRYAKRKVLDLGLWDNQDKAPKSAFDDELKSRAKKSASISQFLTSPDMKYLLIMIKASFDSIELGKSRELISFAEDVMKKVIIPEVTYEFAERYYKNVVETDMIRDDIVILGTLAIFLILLMLYLSLRDFRSLVVIFAPVFMALGITMGITYFVIGHINIVTGFLIGILSGLGVDYGTHMCLRLRLERKNPSDLHPDPIWRTIKSTGYTVFVGATVAALTFYFLCFSTFKAFSEFGFICGTGLMTVLGCLLISFYTLAKWMKLDVRTFNEKSIFSIIKLPRLSLPWGFRIGATLSVLLVIAAFFVSFEYDFEKMMRHSARLEELQVLIDYIYDRSKAPSAFVAYDKETALKIEKLIEKKYIPDVAYDLIGSASIVPDNQEQKVKIIRSIKKKTDKIKDKFIEKELDIPFQAVRTWLSAKPFTFKDIPVHIQDVLRGVEHSQYLVYVYPAVKLYTLDGVRTYTKMIRDVEKNFPNVLTGSDTVIFNDILDLMSHGGVIILFVIIFWVAFFIYLNTRNFELMLLNYVPLILSFAIGMGLMAILGVKFNIFNLALIPSFVALAIDVPLHIVHRAKETSSGYVAARDLTASINLALLNQAIGFGVLILARAGVLKSLGAITLLASLSIWWVGLFLLPAFLERKYKKVSNSVFTDSQSTNYAMERAQN